MFAVIRTGGKQYKVSQGDLIRVEKLDAEAGQSLDMTDVLMIGEGASVSVGTPLEGACVKTTVVEQMRDDKVIVFKKRRRQGYRRKHGHRQDLTVLKVEEILAKGATSSKKAAAPKAETASSETKAAAPKKAAPKAKAAE